MTAHLEKAGTDSREMQAHRCQLSVYLNFSVVPMHRAGWVAHIPQWGREPFNAKCVSTGHQAAVSGPVIFWFVTVVVSLCTNWIGHQPVVCDIVERKLKVGNCMEHGLFFLRAKKLSSNFYFEALTSRVWVEKFHKRLKTISQLDKQRNIFVWRKPSVVIRSSNWI